MIAFVTGLQNPLGVIVKSQYGVSMGVAQLGNFANFIAYACMGIPAGLMLKKYGYKFSLMVAVAVGIIGLGLMFFSGQISRGLLMYFCGAFVAGFSMCLLNAVVNPLLNSLGGGGAHCGYLIMKAIYPQLPVVCVTFGVPCAVSEEIMRSVEEPREIVNFIDEGDYIPSITIGKYTSRARRRKWGCNG